MTKMQLVRIYLTEGDHRLRQLLDILHVDEQVRGVTAFRGIAGFGGSGHIHQSSLVDLSLDLPLVVEFFDEPAKIERIVRDLQDRQMIEPGHLVSWPVDVNIGE